MPLLETINKTSKKQWLEGMRIPRKWNDAEAKTVKIVKKKGGVCQAYQQKVSVRPKPVWLSG